MLQAGVGMMLRSFSLKGEDNLILAEGPSFIRLDVHLDPAVLWAVKILVQKNSTKIELRNNVLGDKHIN